MLVPATAMFRRALGRSASAQCSQPSSLAASELKRPNVRNVRNVGLQRLTPMSELRCPIVSNMSEMSEVRPVRTSEVPLGTDGRASIPDGSHRP